MPILRYIAGRSDKASTLRGKIRYLDNPCKQVWQDEVIPSGLLTGGHGVCFSNAYETFMGLHTIYGLKGTRLFYHLLLDFEAGLVDPFQVREIGYAECGYLCGLGAMFVWGVHCIPHPHMHVVINSILPLTGRKLQIKKGNIFCHKIMANSVLKYYQLPEINMWLPDGWSEEDENG